MRVACIGLGLMGSKLAMRIADRGHTVWGFDIVSDAAVRGVNGARSVFEAVEEAEVVVLSPPTSADGIEVTTGGDVAGHHISAGSLVIDTTTAVPLDSVLMASSLAKDDVGFVDATLSGNIAMAENGELTVMVGGKEPDVERAMPILSTFASEVFRVGPVGSGARMKLVVNHVLGVHRAVLAEALVVSERGGLDLDVVLEVLLSSAAASAAMDLFGQRMIDHEHQPPSSRLRQTLKDAKIIVDNAKASGASSDLAEATLAILEEGEADGLGGWDTSAVIEVLRRR